MRAHVFNNLSNLHLHSYFVLTLFCSCMFVFYLHIYIYIYVYIYIHRVSSSVCIRTAAAKSCPSTVRPHSAQSCHHNPGLDTAPRSASSACTHPTPDSPDLPWPNGPPGAQQHMPEQKDTSLGIIYLSEKG